MSTTVGVLIGLAASAISAVVALWWKTTRDLNIAATQCYDRLIKLVPLLIRKDLSRLDDAIARLRPLVNTGEVTK